VFPRARAQGTLISFFADVPRDVVVEAVSEPRPWTALPPASEPEPDGAVVRGQVDDYLDGPPAAPDLCAVIEVADSSLSVDAGPKLRAYAIARIPQYILVDLVNNRLVIHEDPSGDSYARVNSLERGDVVHVRAGSRDVPIPAERLLP